METVRVQFELPPERLKEVEALMLECGVTTKKEIFNNALTLLKWAVKQVKAGNTVASVDDKQGRYRELTMPIFSNIQPDETTSRIAQ